MGPARNYMIQIAAILLASIDLAGMWGIGYPRVDCWLAVTGLFALPAFAFIVLLFTPWRYTLVCDVPMPRPSGSLTCRATQRKRGIAASSVTTQKAIVAVSDRS